jgi:hypothetical protein
MNNTIKVKQSFILFRILMPIFFIGITVMSIIMTQSFADRVRVWYKERI